MRKAKGSDKLGGKTVTCRRTNRHGASLNVKESVCGVAVDGFVVDEIYYALIINSL